MGVKNPRGEGRFDEIFQPKRKMIYHTVLFKLKEEATQAQGLAMTDALNALVGKIPTLQLMKAGKNFSNRSKGYEYMLVSTFADKEGLEAYAIHPEHVAVVEKYVRPIAADILAVDIEL